MQNALTRVQLISEMKLQILLSEEIELRRLLGHVDWIDAFLEHLQQNLPPARFLSSWAKHQNIRNNLKETKDIPKQAQIIKGDLQVKGRISVLPNPFADIDLEVGSEFLGLGGVGEGDDFGLDNAHGDADSGGSGENETTSVMGKKKKLPSILGVAAQSSSQGASPIQMRSANPTVNANSSTYNIPQTSPLFPNPQPMNIDEISHQLLKGAQGSSTLSPQTSTVPVAAQTSLNSPAVSVPSVAPADTSTIPLRLTTASTSSSSSSNSQSDPSSSPLAAVAPSLYSVVPSPFALRQNQQTSLIDTSETDFSGYSNVESSDIWRRKLIEAMKEKERAKRNAKKK
jgi:hypothetical protein